MSKRDIDIVIGAKDEASKILGDVSKSTQGLATSMSKTAGSVDDSASTVNLSFASLAGITAGVGIAISATKALTGAFTAAVNAVAGMGEAVEAYAQRSREVGLATEAEIAFAEQVQDTTNASVASTLAALRHAQAIGMTADAAQDATVIAQGLAKATGTDQVTAISALRDAMLGNADALSNLIPGIELANTHQERMALVSAHAERGLAMLTAEAGDSIGIMERLQSAQEKLSRQIGQVLAPAFDFVRSAMGSFISAVSDTVQPAIDQVAGSFESLAPVFQMAGEIMRTVGAVIGVVISSIVRIAFDMAQGFATAFGVAGDVANSLVDVVRSVAEGVIFGITALEVAFRNIPAIIEFAVTEALLAMTTFAADVGHLLTVEIPAFASWFADNFTSLMADAFNAVSIAFGNLAIKIMSVGDNLLTYLKSGFQDGAVDLALSISDALSGSLLQGFEAQTQALPEIAERAQTATEKMLQERSSKIASNLTDEFNKTYQSNLAELNKVGKLNVGIEMPDLSTLDIGAMRFAEPVQATESRLQTRGTVEKPFERELLKNASDQLKEQQRQTKAFAEMSKFIQDMKPIEGQPPIIVGTVQ
jgi:hypothetical protein